MEKDDEKFFYEDEVAMVSPKSGLVKYGLILTTNRTRSETELKKSSFKNPNEIKVIWHPNGTEEIISDNKVRQSVFNVIQNNFKSFFYFIGCVDGQVTDAW